MEYPPKTPLARSQFSGRLLSLSRVPLHVLLKDEVFRERVSSVPQLAGEGSILFQAVV